MYTCSICPAEFKTERGLINHKCRWICKCGSKLKTKKGYEKHIQNHGKSESVKLDRQEKQKAVELQRQKDFYEKLQNLKDMGLFTPLYKAGDSVIVSSYVVTKPTHEQRFNRMVRVRYEEERSYSVFDMIIDKVLEPSINDMWRVGHCIENNTPFPVKYLTTSLKTITDSEIFKDRILANEDCDKKRQEYKDHCDFASRCR